MRAIAAYLGEVLDGGDAPVGPGLRTVKLMATVDRLADAHAAEQASQTQFRTAFDHATTGMTIVDDTVATSASIRRSPSCSATAGS